jgi:dTDP-4-dehydrorhamnose reductase
MKIVLTGAGGQLGQALQNALSSHEVVAFDRGQLDITRLITVHNALTDTQPDLVVNAAAFNNVDGAESNPLSAYRINALGPRNLALATAARNIPILHISTDYVFDGTSARPYHEFDKPNPQSVYGASKQAGETSVQTLNPRHYVVRTAWLYHIVGQNFPLTICTLASQQSVVRVVSDQYGSPTYAPHLAAAIARLLLTNAYGIYHLAGQGGVSWFELTRTLYRLLDIRTPVSPVASAEFPRPAVRPPYSILTTIQDPHIVLPPWQQGLEEFAAAVRTQRY